MVTAQDNSSSTLIRTDLERIPLDLDLFEALAGRHLLLTGGTGFFGRWLLALLKRLNDGGAAIKVSVISRAPVRFLDAQPEYRDCCWLNWLTGDIRELVNTPGRPIDLILHAAASTSATDHTRPLELFNTILDGTQRVLDLAVRHNTRRVLFTGSGAQYGLLEHGTPVTENAYQACNSTSATSAYAEAKRAAETLAAIYAQEFGVEMIFTRCFAFSGPGLPLDGHFAIGNFVRDALSNSKEEIVLDSDGKALRSYLHGADLAAWLLFLLSKGEAGHTYNVGSDQDISISDLALRVISRIAPQKSLRIREGAQQSTSRSFYIPNIDKARALGLDVWTSLDQSIDSMAAWAKGHF